jgi:hypothetical protein
MCSHQRRDIQTRHAVERKQSCRSTAGQAATTKAVCSRHTRRIAVIKCKSSQEWAKVIPLLTIEGVHGTVFLFNFLCASPLISHAGDAQLLTMWRRGLPPSARGALWCMAIGNKLGLTDEDFDARVAAASAYTAAAATGRASVADVDGAAAGVPAIQHVSDEPGDDDDKRQLESLLRAQIEMDLQRTMPG